MGPENTVRKCTFGKGFATRRESDSAEADHKRLVKADAKKIPGGMGFVYAVNQYLDYAKRRFARDTYKYKKYVYQSFVDKYNDVLIESITPHHIHNYLDTLKSNNLYNVHRKELSALFNYVKRKMKVDIHNPCADLEKMPHSPAEKKIPSEEDVIKLLLAAKKGDEQDILLCCLHTLGRIDEILRIKWEDVNLQNRIVILWTRKRKDGAYEPDPMPINEDLYEVLSKKSAGA